MTEIRIDAVTKTFGSQVTALAGISATISDGTLHAVLGPSGCGKTTLLRIIAGFETIDAGTICFDDIPVTTPGATLAPERRRVGIVPQDGALFPHLDVAANIAFGLHREPRDDRRRRVAELVALTSLDGLERRRPHELSGGQQQRVALARALAPRPRVVLLDEPFAALDTGLRAELRAEVASTLRASGTTAILVTHDQTEAFSMADTVAVMRAGRITQTATPSELYHRPADLDTAHFVGAAVELPGTRTGTDDVVDSALGRLHARHVDGAHEQLTVMIRPEQIIRDDGGVAATVRNVHFEGSTVAVELDIAGALLRAHWPSQAAPAVGAAITVGVAGTVMAYS